MNPYERSIQQVLREEIWAGGAWLPRRELLARVVGRGRARHSAELALRDLETEGRIKVHRRFGRLNPMYALFTPGELELLLTQLAVLAKNGFVFDVIAKAEPALSGTGKKRGEQ